MIILNRCRSSGNFLYLYYSLFYQPLLVLFGVLVYLMRGCLLWCACVWCVVCVVDYTMLYNSRQKLDTNTNDETERNKSDKIEYLLQSVL